MINNKFFLLVGSILTVLVILFFLRKRIFKTENFKDYTIFYPNQENPSMRAIMANIENYDIKNEMKFYQFNGADSYIYTELLNDTSNNNTIELIVRVIFTDLNNQQTILSGMDWDITKDSENKIKFNKNNEEDVELFQLNNEELLEMKLMYNMNNLKLELSLLGNKTLIENKEIDLSTIYLGKKFVDENTSENTSENFFNGLMGGIIINSINLESLTEAVAPEEPATQSTSGTTTQSTTGATTQSTTGATTQSTTGATTQSTTGATTQSTTGATTQSTTDTTTQSTTGATTTTLEPTTSTTLALENNMEILGGINETQPEVDYINTINMQNIAQNLNNNVNLELENTINNSLQVNNTTSQVNNTMPQINNTTAQVNNTTSQVNNTTAQVNKTINNALQANIVRRVEKLENILSSAPVAYNSLDNYNDITIDINFV